MLVLVVILAATEPPLPALLRATGRGQDRAPGRRTYSAATART